MNSNIREDELYTEKIHTKNKLFIVDLKKNDGGYYVKLSEISNKKKSFIFVPVEGIDELIQTLENIKKEIKKQKNSNGEY